MFQSHEVIEIEPDESVFDAGEIPISRFNSHYENGEMFDSIHSQAQMIKPSSSPTPSSKKDENEKSEQNDPTPPPKAPVDDEKQDEKPETILLGPFELVKEKVMAVPGLLRLLAVGLLLIMFICAIAGGGPGAFKFLIFCWVLFTPATAYLSLKDWHPDGPPEMLSPVLEFSLVRLAVFAVAFVFTFFGALVAWSKNEGSGAQQAAGAFGALAGVAMGANAFFAFRQRREEIEKLAADKADEGRLFHRLKKIIILNL